MSIKDNVSDDIWLEMKSHSEKGGNRNEKVEKWEMTGGGKIWQDTGGFREGRGGKCLALPEGRRWMKPKR